MLICLPLYRAPSSTGANYNTVKPAQGSYEINPDHPLSDGLIACWLYGNTFDDLGNTITLTSGSLYYPNYDAKFDSEQWTYFLIASSTTNDDNYYDLLALGYYSSPTDIWDAGIQTQPNSPNIQVIGYNNDNFANNAPASAFYPNSRQSRMIRYNAPNLTSYANGAPDGTRTVAQRSDSRKTFHAGTPARALEVVLGWERALTDDEIAQLQAAPYSMLREI